VVDDLLKAAILGAVQGITEFLPVSSTAHLIILEDALDADDGRFGLPFDAAAHLGTLLALLWVFGATWVELARGGLRSITERSLAPPGARLAWLIVLATIPAAVAGFVFEDQIEDHLRSPAFNASVPIAFSGVLVLAERVGRGGRGTAHQRWLDALIVGVAQAVALIPGVSRSGATISAGLVRDLTRVEAATFAFLLSAPIVAGAGLFELAQASGDFTDGTRGGADIAVFATGFAFAAITGYAAIRFLLRFLATNTLIPFVIYRIAFGALVLTLVATGVLS
jgi:undecaprenyl-diphosphatase